MKQYTPPNWPVTCQCTTCQTDCGFRFCAGDCRANCTPEYDCNEYKAADLAACGKLKQEGQAHA
ncbi:hypothetical protein [Sporomusa sp. KB1]|jgi:hypothetical protein|uniref:hypothetical protein n=1 Tax=Sporomusa sp. KB1 TaxID=943346 RepID=UPI0011A7CDC0|nr:hypothetical protein [Sporomusa sp. KB1]TWH49622.1 hypothetical protein Salpa_5861 [Sporomusa sp. KB1]